MSSSPVKQLWYKWKMLRLPWRKRFLVGEYKSPSYCYKINGHQPNLYFMLQLKALLSLLSIYGGVQLTDLVFRLRPLRQHILGIQRCPKIKSLPTHRTVHSSNTLFRGQNLSYAPPPLMYPRLWFLINLHPYSPMAPMAPPRPPRTTVNPRTTRRHRPANGHEETRCSCRRTLGSQRLIS